MATMTVTATETQQTSAPVVEGAERPRLKDSEVLASLREDGRRLRNIEYQKGRFVRTAVRQNPHASVFVPNYTEHKSSLDEIILNSIVDCTPKKEREGEKPTYEESQQRRYKLLNNFNLIQSPTRQNVYDAILRSPLVIAVLSTEAQKLVDEDLLKLAVSRDGNALEWALKMYPHIPMDGVIRTALKRNGNAIRFIEGYPREGYLELALTTTGNAIRHVVEYKPKSEFVTMAINSNPFAVRHIPDALLTLEQKRLAISSNPLTIRFMNADLDLFQYAVSFHCKVYKFVPAEFKSALKQTYKSSNLKYRVAWNALKRGVNPHYSGYVDKNLHNEAVSHGIILDESQMTQGDWAELVCSNSVNFCKVPTGCVTTHMCLKAFQKWKGTFEEFWFEIPDGVKTPSFVYRLSKMVEDGYQIPMSLVDSVFDKQ